VIQAVQTIVAEKKFYLLPEKKAVAKTGLENT